MSIKRIATLIIISATLALAGCGSGTSQQASHKALCFTTPSGQTVCGQAADSYCTQVSDVQCAAYLGAKDDLALEGTEGAVAVRGVQAAEQLGGIFQR